MLYFLQFRQLRLYSHLVGPLSGASLAAFYAFVALPDASLAAFYASVAQMGGPVAPKLIQLTHFTHLLCILSALWAKTPPTCGHPCASSMHLCAQTLPLCSAAVLSVSHCCSNRGFLRAPVELH